MYARVMVSITEKGLSFSGFIAAAKLWLCDYPWRAKGWEMGDTLILKGCLDTSLSLNLTQSEEMGLS